jgi:hypothetical protein
MTRRRARRKAAAVYCLRAFNLYSIWQRTTNNVQGRPDPADGAALLRGERGGAGGAVGAVVDSRGLLVAALLHVGPVEFLYYWLHRALHHHYLYARYHSHHHASIVTEPITCTLHTPSYACMLDDLLLPS